MPRVLDLSEFAGKFKSIIDRGSRFLLITHVRPDGDAYGCILALAHALEAYGKKPVLWNQDGISDRYQFLPGSSKVSDGKPPEGPFDARIVLDNASVARAGRVSLEPSVSSPVINIDHHASNPGYGDLAYIDVARSSCGEILFDLLKLMQMPLTQEAAKCLFVAISTDTGSFQYPSVKSSTFKIGAQLLELGVDVGETSRQTYESYPARRLLLLREVLQSAKFEANDRIAYCWINDESYRRSGAKPEDTEGMIDHIRSVSTVKVAVVFEEVKSEGSIRLSFRSKDSRIDVNAIAQKFGGGGHPAAAGARVKGECPEVEKKVLEALRQALP